MHKSIVFNMTKNFFMGGVIVSVVSLVGTFFNPLLGAIVWSFPASLIPTLYFMKAEKKSNKYLSQFALSSSYGIGLLLAGTLLLSYFLKHSPEKEHLLIPISKMAGGWVVCAILFYVFVKYFHLETRFM